jgi:acetoin utilization deacetylase AcuC-like enzyme
MPCISGKYDPATGPLINLGDRRQSCRPGGLRLTGAASMAFISHADCGHHDTGWGHPEHAGRLRAIATALEEDSNLFMALKHVRGRYATDAELELVHHPRYIGTVREMAYLAAHKQYVDSLRWGVEAAVGGFTPDLVLISAGFDSLRGDPLGGFTLEFEHVDALTRWLVDAAAAWCGGRVVSALEGGYNTDLLGRACAAHVRALL